jgi:RHS repeat-associated protein
MARFIVVPPIDSIPQFAATLILALAGTAHADQILNINSDSLTTYLPSSATPVQDVRPLVDQRGVFVGGDPATEQSGGGGEPPDSGGGSPDGLQPDDDCGRRRGDCTTGPIHCEPAEAHFGVPPGGLGSGVGIGSRVGGVNLFTGAFTIEDVDLAPPAPGIHVVIGRSFNSRQKNSGGSYIVSDGPQGKNWFQTSQAELVFYDDATNSKDMIYMVFAADRFLEFKRKDSGSSHFVATNGSEGMLSFAAGASTEPDTYTWASPDGMQTVFFGFDGDSGVCQGQFWKVTDPAGHTIYAGHKTTGSTAIADGYDGSGRIDVVYQELDASALRRMTYDYTSGRLDSVIVAEKPSGGSFTNTGEKVEYFYYVDNDSGGQDGDLKRVKITTPLTDSGEVLVKMKHYRYYEGAYHATNNPGYEHQIKYIIGFEGSRRYEWLDSMFDDDILTASDNDIKPYASAFFKYDTERRIINAWTNGGCGCSGAADGEHVFEYETNGSFVFNAGYDTDWLRRTIVKFPARTDLASDTNRWLTQYFDEAGQPLHRVISDADPDSASNFWVTAVTRNSDGQVEQVQSPANISNYDHDDVTYDESAGAGLITIFNRQSSGDLKGYVLDVKHKTGTSGSAYLDRTYTYATRKWLVNSIEVPLVVLDSSRVYSQEVTSGTTGSYLTSFSYDYFSGTDTNVLYIVPKKITTTYPAVDSGNNGSGSATTTKVYLRQDRSVAFRESASGVFNYSEYENGRAIRQIADVQTNSGDIAVADDPNGIWGITETGTGLHELTDRTHDTQGRTREVIQERGATDRITKTHYSQLADGRRVTLHYADVQSGTYYGPVQFSVTNQAGQMEIQGSIKLTNNENDDPEAGHIDEGQSDIVAAIDLGTIARLSVNIYDETGTKLEESRAYFNLTSIPGAEGSNYDSTFFGYDNSGHRWRVKDPTGTIRRTVYDNVGRPIEQWIGTNDNDTETVTTPEKFPGGETSGTCNMVKVSATTYDSGSAGGNSLVTSQTQYIQDNTTGQRVTSYLHDVRGRTIVQVNPTSGGPHVLSKYDNMGRMIATAQYSSSSGLDAGDDPTSLATNRMALSQTFYNERGQVWKSQRHKIDDADGSDDDNLQTLIWFDANGRTIKVDGGQLAKTFYDRLGRTTHQFVLASDNDSTYGDADDVGGDIVLQETQNTYDPDTDELIMTAAIERFQDDLSSGTTGALDTNADGDALLYTAANVLGRIQITAMWHDQFGRTTETVNYGTYNGANFDRDGLSVPARSDTALLTEYRFNTGSGDHDGTLKRMIDPRGLETRYVHDDAGRQVAFINNYVDGTPGGVTSDDDVYTRYAYTDGQKTKMHVDFDGAGDEDATDQITTWTYGVGKGASAGDSKIASGGLLQKVVYPPQSGGQAEADRRVRYAYNAQGQQIWTEDQTGTITEFEYDDSGRQTHRKLTTIDGSLDNAVLRISTTYDSLGRRSLVTQYNNASPGSGSVTDEVKFTYDDWGNLEQQEQDNDSVVGGGTPNDYEIRYTYAKTTTGRNAIQRSTQVLAYASTDKLTVTYEYLSSNGLLDAAASRVTRAKIGATTVAWYWYNGVGSVVGIDHDEADIFNHRYGAISGVYPDLDRFNRVVGDTWWKDLSTDLAFFDTDIFYDRNSNITRTEDLIFTPAITAGFDVAYTMDNLNRLSDADEGDWNGSSISNRSRRQVWTLDQVGNWALNRVDRNGDGDRIDAGEIDDSRTHNPPNEITDRDIDSDGDTAYDDVHYDLAYNKRGDMTDDAQYYEYVYDGFGRLRKIKNTSSGALIEEFWYNGLGHRISWLYDTNGSGTVDTSTGDVKFHLAYDDRWRCVQVFRDTDTSPKEQFIYHCAGADGMGGSSYIDTVILREKDANTNWTSAADGTLERRDYYCHNWRGDVSVLITSSGGMVGWAKYSAYGIPYGIPCSDTNGDGTVNGTDNTNVSNWWATPATRPTADADLDGDVDIDDLLREINQSGVTLGWGVLSQSILSGGDAAGNRKGYAGYEFDPVASYSLWHVRNRVLNSDLGRWKSHDPIPYIDGNNSYEYVRSMPILAVDALGLWCLWCSCSTPWVNNGTTQTDTSSCIITSPGQYSGGGGVPGTPCTMRCNVECQQTCCGTCSYGWTLNPNCCTTQWVNCGTTTFNGTIQITNHGFGSCGPCCTTPPPSVRSCIFLTG